MKKENNKKSSTEREKQKVLTVQILDAEMKGEFLVFKCYELVAFGRVKPTVYLAFNTTDRWDMNTVYNRMFAGLTPDENDWNLVEKSKGRIATVYEKYAVTGEEELEELREQWENRTK